MANKLATMGYFRKRLRDSGYVVEELYRYYSKTDPRIWTVVIDPGYASIFCTCYQNRESIGDDHFEIYDGGQFIPGRFKIKTSSIETFVEYLNRFNITGKIDGYGEASNSHGTPHDSDEGSGESNSHS